MLEPILRPSDSTNLAGVETGREHISHSRLSAFLACHRRYELHYQERLEPISKPEALSMGSAFQKAIEHGTPSLGPEVLDGWTVTNVHERDCIPAPDWWPIGNLTMHGPAFYLVPPAEPIHFHTQEAEDKHRVQQAVVRAAAALYLRTWPEPLGETREFEYVVRLRNPWTGHYSRTFDLKGYADGVIDRWDSTMTVDPPNCPLELVENKLVSAVKATSVQDLPLDQQLRLARYGLWRATGRTVGKVHYRWIKKPSIKQKQKESLDEYLERVAADYEQRPEFYVVEDQPTFVVNNDLLMTEEELWTYAEEIRAARRRRIFPRNTASCRDYGRCDFIELCRGDEDAHALYQVRPERTEA